MYLVGLHIYYKMIHGPYNIETESNAQFQKRGAQLPVVRSPLQINILL